MTGATSLRIAREGRVLILTMESDCGRNPVSPDLGRAIKQCVAEAETDPNVGAILLMGSGKAFSAGGDINDLLAGIDNPRPDDEIREFLRHSASGCTALMDSAKPTIALVSGAAAGGGLALAAACDIRLAGASAKFAFAYPRIGLAGDLAVNWSLTRILGPAKALYFGLTSKVVSAAEALATGLVSEVHPDAGLREAGLALAADIAAMSPMALAQVKANMAAARELPRAEAISVESENFLAARAYPDHREAATAFTEKRAPRWS